MKTYHEEERRPAVDPASTIVTVRMVDNAVDAETLLPLPVLNRPCSIATPLRRILQNSGYAVSLAGTELIWFEKALVGYGAPSKCA